jgi:hypothetical protein
MRKEVLFSKESCRKKPCKRSLEKVCKKKKEKSIE